MPKVESETQQRAPTSLGVKTQVFFNPHNLHVPAQTALSLSLLASGAQVPSEKRDRVYRMETGTEPHEWSEGPQVSPGEGREKIEPCPTEWSQAAPFLGKKTVVFCLCVCFLTSLGNWKPWVPPRAIKRMCPLTRLKIKEPPPRGTLGWEEVLCRRGRVRIAL